MEDGFTVFLKDLNYLELVKQMDGELFFKLLVVLVWNTSFDLFCFGDNIATRKKLKFILNIFVVRNIVSKKKNL